MGLLDEIISNPKAAKEKLSSLTEGGGESAKPDPLKDVDGAPVVTPPNDTPAGTPPKVTETTTAPDLYAPLKERLGDRPLTEWLGEVDEKVKGYETNTKRLIEVEEELKTKEERIKALDLTQSRDYQVHVVQPILKAQEGLELLFGDKASTDEFLASLKDKGPKDRQVLIKKAAEEYGIGVRDLNLSLNDYNDVVQKGKEFITNYQQYQKQKQESFVVEEETRQKALRESERKTIGQLASKAVVKLGEEVPAIFKDELEKHSASWLESFDKGRAGGQIDLQQEIYYNVLGRAVAAKFADLEETLVELDKLSKAARSKAGIASAGGARGTKAEGAVGLGAVLPGLR